MLELNFRSSRICFNADIITIRQFFSPLSMIFSTIGRLSFASSSLAAVIQICRSVGIFSRALFKTCIINHFINVSSVAKSKGSCLGSSKSNSGKNCKWCKLLCPFAVHNHKSRKSLVFSYLSRIFVSFQSSKSKPELGKKRQKTTVKKEMMCSQYPPSYTPFLYTHRKTIITSRPLIFVLIMLL